MYQDLKPISSAPGLRTVNTIGLALYGHSDHDPENNSFAATHYFVALFLPIFPVGRYRVIQDGNGYRFLGKLPFRKFDRWHLGIAISAVIVMLLVVNFSSPQTSSYTPPANLSTSSVPVSSETPSSLAARPVDSPASSMDSGSSDNQTRLAAIKTQIDSGRSRISALKLELDPVIDELTRLKSQMEPLDSELNHLDRQRKAGEAIDMEDFNSKVEAYNSLVARRRTLFNAHKADLQTYEELQKQDSALVDQYNALLKEAR
jgi:anti-sigma28 factor (negative regulator of flagellin synthesis)